MIGGGELEEETHRLAEELGVTDVITFPGFKARKKSGRPWKSQKSIWSPVTAKKAGGSGE